MKSITFFLVNLEGGGVQKAALTFIRQLMNVGIKTYLVVLDGNGPLRGEIPKNLTFFDLKIKRTRWAFFSILKYLVKQKPNLVISSQTHLNLLMIILKQLCRYPDYLVVREHNSFTKEMLNDKKLFERMRIKIIKYFYPLSDRFEVVSEYVEKSIRDFCQYKKEIIVLQNGIDLSIIQKHKQAPTNFINRELNNNKKYIVGIGRLAIQKNFSLLIKAFSLLDDQIDAELIILGEGPERRNLEKLCYDLQVSDRVKMPGFLENPFSVLSRADVFVLSSNWEGYGNVIMEASAVGVPIISTDCPGPPIEILRTQKFSLVVPMNNPQAMAIAMRELLESEINKDEILEFSKQFDIAKVAVAYEELVEKYG